MIALVLSMINARRAQAATLFLLAAIAVASAVAGQVAARAIDAAIVHIEVANATHRERGISLVAFNDPAQAFTDADSLSSLVRLDGFELIRGGELTVFGPVTEPGALQFRPGTRLVFRDGICGHVIILDGRCLVGGREIIVGAQTAQRVGLEPGGVALVQAMRYDPSGLPIPDGAPAAMTVVGVYEPVDTDEPYWGGQRYFPIASDGTRDEAVFVSPGTMALIEHTVGISFVDSLAPPEVLTPQRMEVLAEEVEEVLAGIENVRDVTVGTDVPVLAERIATSRKLAGQLGPVAFIPLAGISFFVIYLAVGYGIFGRRGELGLVALRGVSTRRRWVLATGETVVAILLGAPVGYVLGHLGVGLLASVRLGSNEGTELSLASLPYASVALVIAVAVALLGQRRSLAEPVVELLRGVPRARGLWQAIAVEALVGALAVVATLQLRAGDNISGLGLLVPGLLVVAVALLAARINVAVTGLVARFALRRGLVGAGLSAVQLARRPGNQRLFALLAVGTAMLAFVAAGIDVAGRARENRATVQLGAPRILEVHGADARQLFAATEQLDPDGAWAMAVSVLPPRGRNDATTLAVDASRLAAVATWRPEFGVDPGEVAAAIAAPAPSPLTLMGDQVEVDLEVAVEETVRGIQAPPFVPVQVTLEFVRMDSQRRVPVVLPDLVVGRHQLTVRAPGCDEGCRLVAIAVPDMRFGTNVVLRGVRQLDPPADIVTSTQLIDRDRWRITDNALAIPSAGALSIELQARQFGSNDVRVAVMDGEFPIPFAAIGSTTATRVSSLDGSTLAIREALRLSMAPRLGDSGVLVDLRHLERTLLGVPAREPSEIWLGESAPADAVEQFRSIGLAVVDESSIGQTRAVLGRQGPALALHFHLAAAALGVLLAVGGLGLVAAVDRRQRAADLRALRVQGLPRRMVRRAALWGYLSTVVLAALTGLLGAAVAWAAAGDRIPIFTDAASALTPPRWPQWAVVIQPWAVATAVMMAAAVLAAWALRRAVRAGRSGNGQ